MIFASTDLPTLTGEATKDTEAVRKAILDLLDKINSSQVETGSNTSGYWIKYPDGRMIQYGMKSGGPSGNSASGSLYIATGAPISITFPIRFVAPPPTIFATGNDDSSNGFACSNIPSFLTTSGTSFYLYRSANVSATWSFQWQAIGNWK